MADKAHSAGNPACKSSVPIIKRRDSNRDAAILNAFEQWKSAHAERRALPDSGPQAEGDIFTIEERAAWDAIDKAEDQIIKPLATTPAGVACKLWVAIPHNTTDAEPEYAALRADLAWFEAEGDALDWNVRCIVSALVALKTMEG